MSDTLRRAIDQATPISESLDRWFDRLPILEELTREVIEIQKRRREDGKFVHSMIVSKNSGSKERRERFDADTARLEVIARFLYLPGNRLRGLSVDEYLTMLVEQECRCAICRRDLGPERLPCIDHNHETGETRGFLCGSCNSAIGLLGDSPTILRAALAYLTERGHYGQDDQ